LTKNGKLEEWGIIQIITVYHTEEAGHLFGIWGDWEEALSIIAKGAGIPPEVHKAQSLELNKRRSSH